MTRRITVDVYEADNVTPAGTLGSDRGREWLDDLSAEGSYTIESKLDHADEALLTDTRVLRFCIDGTPRWPALVEDRNVVLADPSARQSGRVIGAAGRGLLAIFDTAVVLPELGFGRISPDNRYFGWMSRYYDHSWWGNAIELKQVNDPDPSKPWYGAPKGFTDKDAFWVGPTDGDVPGAVPGGGKPGYMLLWGEYTVPVGEGGDYMGSTTADDGFELFRDGDREAAEARVALWGQVRPVPMQLDEGPHFFGVKVTNFDRPNPATNVFGYILSLAKMLGGGVATGDVVARSSAGTKMLAFPDTEPGMTAGHIVLVNIVENQAYGWHPDLTCDFDENVDSNGAAWTVQLNVSYPVNSPLSGMLRHLTDIHAADFAMDPVGKVLHAYVSKGTDRTDAVTVAYGVNVNRLKAQHVAPGGNTAIARTAEGRWLLLEDSAAVETYGRRFVGLTLGSAPSDASANQQAAAFFDDNAYPVEAITDLQVEDDAFIDGTVKVGDLVTGPTIEGSDVFRVHGLRFAEDDAGQPICTPELVRQPDPAENDDWANARLIGGLFGTVLANSTGATSEASEPIPTNGPGDGPWRSLWFRWVAPSSGDFFFSTQGSRKVDLSGLDTALGVYTGASLAGLVEVESNDDYGPFTGPDDLNSRAAFTAVADTTYYIQVSGYDNTEEGRIVLTWGSA